MSSVTARALLGLFTGSALCGAAHAERAEFGAGIDLQQVVESQLSGVGGDNVTYTEITGSGSARINNRRIVATANLSLSYRLNERGELSKSLTRNGVMRMNADVIDEWLTMQTGAVITRSRIDPSGAAPQFNTGNPQNLAQTYSAYIQPDISHKFGDLGLAASYRYAYTKNSNHLAGQTGPSIGPLTNSFDSSKAQQGSMSLGMEQSDLPFSWSLSSLYRHENTSNLASHLRDFSVIGEVKVPVAETIALVASSGYQSTRSSEREALIDPTTGLPVVGNDGGFVVDPASPRLLTYDMAGFIGDAGIIWKPSQRTRIEARAGYRYGGLSVTGLVEMKPSPRSGLTIIVTDQFQSFGLGVSSGLAGTPPNLNLGSLDPGSSYQNCLFGVSAGSGRCIGGSLGQASASNYRERAATIIFNRTLREWSVSTAIGYTRRNYVDTPGTPGSLIGVVDQSIFGNLTLSGKLTRLSGVAFSFSGNLFKNGQVGASDVVSGSFTSSYRRSLGRNIGAQASVSVDASKQDGVTADVSGRAQLGLQYQF